MPLEINQRIACCRKLRNMTQSDLAQMLNIKTSTYSQMERKGDITAERLIKIADFLNVDIKFLLFGEEWQEIILAKPPERILLKEEKVKKKEETPEYILTAKEKRIIAIWRYFSQKNKNEFIAVIEKMYKQKTK